MSRELRKKPISGWPERRGLHRTDPMPYIYLVHAANGLTKIGRATSLANRLRTLRTFSPVPLKLIYAVKLDDAIAAETRLHWLYQRKRTHGEWFRLTMTDCRNISATYSFRDVTRSYQNPFQRREISNKTRVVCRKGTTYEMNVGGINEAASERAAKRWEGYADKIDFDPFNCSVLDLEAESLIEGLALDKGDLFLKHSGIEPAHPALLRARELLAKRERWQ